ncbi:MATE family efflux transporter [Sphingomonas sp. Root710]|uniref:MATE family efflux transporter n=1 Tax=Sphingomonas sp. Root710 TaxID=1736594 RepID=UPI0006F1DECD|nr:MATE family efflux transporter [Sphingomonas sp. Root710]KRB79696.1 MATE family efflux transporter [Sphingomonas sp. Root710]
MDDNVTPKAPWRAEARALLSLSVPLVIGNLGWSAIAAIDLLLLGRLGADSVAAGALALNLYHAFLICGIGLTTAASPLIASERGRRLHSVRDIRRTFRQTIWAAALICVPSWFALWQATPILIFIGQDPELAVEAARLMHALQWALLPYLMFMTMRNFVAALERPIWGVIVTLAAVPFNALAGWVLIFGHFGLPAMGLHGAGLASFLTSLFMAMGLAGVIMLDRRFRRYHLFGRFWRADWSRFRTVWRVGLPIAVTLGFEVTVFNAAVFLMGLIGRAPLAAHAIALQIAALCFMVPMGIGQAATVRVGYAHGRRDRAAAGRAGWLALLLGTAFAAFSAAMLVAIPRLLVGGFIDVDAPANAEVTRLAISFLAVAALFQLADGAQAIGAGVLRGLQDTRVPMIFAAFGYWVIGIGVGTLLAFPVGLDGIGIWLGLASGLGVVAILLVWRWAWRERLGLVPG